MLQTIFTKRVLGFEKLSVQVFDTLKKRISHFYSNIGAANTFSYLGYEKRQRKELKKDKIMVNMFVALLWTPIIHCLIPVT